jgi:hypothetical protein
MKMVELKRVFMVKKELNGVGPVIFSWHPNNSYLACAGSSRIVNITNRQGEAVAEIPLTGCARGRARRTAGRVGVRARLVVTRARAMPMSASCPIARARRRRAGSASRSTGTATVSCSRSCKRTRRSCRSGTPTSRS